ncbi:response regulator transcription factor [Halodesulfovibrio sp.]|jgi:two-component system phosphate regulon response regulator PhoB|uniref:response regulator n=1 Tax=Halodesulfovibrio sp. TaxID=1912772 RepID=UPI0025EE1F3D|nr:response regulator transcription factor [Halodesulfovibrio sp.]MCT4534277.1 response regulator transcription factor [Halodesulfovibrio sp.]MCT4627110.1 response regulator transcription factor [Halodesulfovibrio sp.]
MTNTILLVEDDEDIRQLLTFTFEAAGFDVITRADGQEGLDAATAEMPDVVILDIMLPSMSGLDICKELKRNADTESIPVIMLTARGEEVDRVVGLELGADDYVVKPFSPRELVLRVRAVLKRNAPAEPVAKQASLKIDGLVMDMDAYKVLIDGEEVLLTATEFKLLAELLKNKGRVRTRDQLLNTVWGYEFEGYARTVDTHVRRLRQKIGDYANYIETMRGVGYRFKD